jgi:hypothetical protein
MIVYYYPRPFLFGHSEPLDNFMKGYIPDLLSSIHPNGTLNSNFSGMSKYTPGQMLFPLVATDDPNSAPLLYLYFALGSSPKKSVGGIVDNLVPDCSLADEIATSCKEPTQSKADLKKWDNLNADLIAIDKAISNGEAKYKASLKTPDPSKLKDMRLAFLLDKKRYIKNIKVMYDFRKSGGFGNMTLLEITMLDFILYVWKAPNGKVPYVWHMYWPDVFDFFNFLFGWFKSPTVNKFVMTLPAIIGGVDVEKFTPPPISMQTKGDTIETFGFLKGLMEIPKILMTIATFFTTLQAVAMAIAESITNPIKILKMIIGMIVGVILVILYMLLIALNFLLYIPAAIYVAFIDIIKTIFWIFLFLIMAIFYLFIWLLDMVTGGLFLKIMRCENLPNKWYTQPGYFLNNKYVRGFMCNFTCSTRYQPSDNGMWCDRLPIGRPSFCPQQILYNAVQTVINDIPSPIITGTTSDRKLMYKFIIPASYYGLDEIGKKTKIVTFLKNKRNYLNRCYKYNKEFSTFALASCKYFHKLKTENDPLYEKYKKIIDKSLDVCESTHCGEMFYNISKIKKADCPFCPADDAVVDEKETAIDDGSDGSIYQKILYSILALTILMIGFAIIFHYSVDRLNFTNLWKS